MKKSRIKAIAMAAIIAVGLLGGVTTAHAEEGAFNYLDSWDSIHGNDFEAADDNASTTEPVVNGAATLPDIPSTEATSDVESKSITTGASDFIGGTNSTDYADDTTDSAPVGTSVGDYISSDVTIGQKGSPDLNIDFSMNGGDQNDTGLFTPDGNLTLVDDLDSQEAASLQYMTVQTKNGTTFYIIIDRSTDKDNVYFLNPVDAADLMALMDDDTKAKYQTNTEAQAKANNASGDASGSTGDKSGKQDKKADKKENGTNPFGTLLIFVILGGGGAAAYYFLKIKPKKNQVKNDDEDMEFYDDEEYDMENPEPEDTGDSDEESDEDDSDDNSDDDSDDDLDEEDY